MRLRRLDLIRYGHFTDSSLELPRGEPDLHIVVGPNEAGKSTVRSAVGDLLFGIPSRSPYGFIHKYGSMRIGAILEARDQVLEVRRRKGSQDTLLASDDTRIPAGEQALRPFLHGADKDFFERMFCLDHLRLRRGGQEILDDRADDTGQKLFAAGSGIQGLQRRFKKLEDEAARLWTIRRSKDRKFYIAEDRLKAADGQRRESTVSADRWRELQRAYADRQSEHDQLQSQIHQAEKELSRVARIRRIARDVDEKSRLEAEIEGLGTVTEIPADSSERLRNAQHDLDQAAPLLEEKGSALRKAQAERMSIQWDGTLLHRKSDIESLHQQRIQVKKGIVDLPGLKRRLAEQQTALVAMAADCGWTGLAPDAIAERIPHRSQVETARTLLEDWSKQRALVASARTSAEEAASRLEEIRRELEAVGTPQDVRNLAALTVAAKNEHGGIGSQVVAAQADAASERAEVDHLYSALDPQPGSVELAQSLLTPGEPEVQEFRDRRRDLDQRLRANREQRASQRKELASAEESVKQLAAEGEPITLGAVLKARESRNKLWIALRNRFIDSGDLDRADSIELEGDSRQLADRYQDEVARADQLSDLRSDMARSTAEVTEARRRVAVVKSELAGTEEELGRLENEDRQMVAEWSDLWAALPFTPHGPDRMLTWLATRDRLGEAVSRSAKSDRQLAALHEQESQVVTALAEELGRFGEDSGRLKQHRLAMVLERAEQVQAHNERLAESAKKLGDALHRAIADAGTKRSRLESKQAELEHIEREWTALAGKLAIDPKASSTDASGMLGTLGEMREVASRIGDLRTDRIEKIERDIGRFRTEVKTLARAIGPDLQERDASEATVELESRLDVAETARRAAESKDREIQDLEKRVGELKASRQTSESVIRDLQTQAGVSDVEHLRSEIKKAERYSSLRESVADLTKTILQDGDRLPLAELVAECSGADLDELEERERSLESSIADLRQSFLAARDHLRDAKAVFDNVGGSNSAATAEGARQSALAEIQEIAEQFIQLRAAACLLRWAIERYRSEKQGPMLQRAGQLFSTLTLDSFQRLEVDYNEQDQAQIVGCRLSGERVPTSGMSDGSLDQLYLALRVAALEDYLEQSPQMPFVADDLFINFDDARAAAGFGVLAGLAQRCQVIFFTHHDHLAELAQESLDFPVRVLRIGS